MFLFLFSWSSHCSFQVFVLSYLATILVLRMNGMGFSGKTLSLNEMINTVKTALAIEIIYYLCVNSVKISILLFYLRISKASYRRIMQT